MTIRCLAPDGLPVAVYAVEVDGECHALAEVEAIIAAYHAARTPNVSVRPAHRVSRVLCKVSGCGEKRTGKSRYCKKHDMRFKRHGSPETKLRPWEKTATLRPKKKGTKL